MGLIGGLDVLGKRKFFFLLPADAHTEFVLGGEGGLTPRLCMKFMFDFKNYVIKIMS